MNNFENGTPKKIKKISQEDRRYARLSSLKPVNESADAAANKAYNQINARIARMHEIETKTVSDWEFYLT